MSCDICLRCLDALRRGGPRGRAEPVQTAHSHYVVGLQLGSCRPLRCGESSLDAIENPHEETRCVYRVRCLGDVVIADLAMTGRIAERAVGTDEELADPLLLATNE